MGEPDELREEQRPASPSGTGPDAPGEPGEAGRSREYAARRRGWIGEHSRDDRFLIFIGVAVLMAVLFLVAYRLVEDWNIGEELPPVPLAELFYGEAEEISPGVVRVKYDFKIDPRIDFLRDACPQMGDWAITGTIDNQGILFSADNRYRPFFTGEDVSVECDAAIAFGTQVAVDLCSLYDGGEGDFYRFELVASPGGQWPASAQIVRYRGGGRLSGRSVEIPELKVSRKPRDPPTFYRVRFELVEGVLYGYFARKGEELARICQRKADDDLVVGTVKLRGPASQTAFDNVVITGHPHPEFVSKRTQIYHLFKGEDASEAPAGAESEPPVAAAVTGSPTSD